MHTQTIQTHEHGGSVSVEDMAMPSAPTILLACDPATALDLSPDQSRHEDSCPTDPAPTDTLDYYQRILSRVWWQRRLFSVHWELTYRCNQRCTHCFLDVLPPAAKAPGELTTEECKQVIDELAEMGTLNLTFSGGEVLVRRDFFEIAEYARKKRFAVRIFTNGTLITEQTADRIAGLHPVAIDISVYGAKPDTHDKITLIPGSWHKTIRAVRLLQEREVKTILKIPLMHDNISELDDLWALASELGADLRYDITITTKDTGDRSPLRHRLTDEDLLWLFRKDMKSDRWKRRMTKESDRFCTIGGSSVTIGPDGSVFPCIEIRTPIGNVRQQSLRSIWNDSPVWGQLQRLTLGALPVCSTCDLRHYCVRCHGVALVEDGDLLGCSSVARREALIRRQVLVEKGVILNEPGHSNPDAGS